jgi:hypothetical protein
MDVWMQLERIWLQFPVWIGQENLAPVMCLAYWHTGASTSRHCPGLRSFADAIVFVQ